MVATISGLQPRGTTVKAAIMPYLARALSSNRLRSGRRTARELARRLAGRPHRMQVFLRANDPYSFLLVQIMDQLLARFDIQASYHTVLHLPDDMYPEPELWHRNACRDAAHLARLYGLEFPQSPIEPEPDQVARATAALLAAENRDDFLDQARGVFAQLWHPGAGKLPASASLDDELMREQLAANEALLERLGHYFSAMIHYGGEWYWGLDRLDHLERRLIDLGLARTAEPSVRFDLTYRDFCRRRAQRPPSPDRPLVLYWSARSPYSHIALLRSVELTRFHGLTLDIRPVMPMMMRGMKVPKTKKMYIFHDTKREADKLGIAYGFVADPLGPAVERCYALLDYARREDRLTEFLLSFARGVNAEGIRAETDAGLARIVGRAGLDWETARPLLADSDWRREVDSNLEEMRSLGLWGVPCFRYGDIHFWGQDRLGLMEQAILEDLAKPDGPRPTGREYCKGTA